MAEREFNRFRQQFNTVDVTKESELYLTQSITLETQKAQLEQQVAEAAAKYTNEHPVMQQMNAQLGAINKRIAELDGTLQTLARITTPIFTTVPWSWSQTAAVYRLA